MKEEEEENETPLSREIKKLRNEPFVDHAFRNNPNLRGIDKIDNISREDYEFTRFASRVEHSTNQDADFADPRLRRHLSFEVIERTVDQCPGVDHEVRGVEDPAPAEL